MRQGSPLCQSKILEYGKGMRRMEGEKKYYSITHHIQDNGYDEHKSSRLLINTQSIPFQPAANVLAINRGNNIREYS